MLTDREFSVWVSGVVTTFQPPCLHICTYFAHTLQDFLFFFQFFKYLFLLAFFFRPYTQNDRPHGRDFSGDRKIKAFPSGKGGAATGRGERETVQAGIRYSLRRIRTASIGGLSLKKVRIRRSPAKSRQSLLSLFRLGFAFHNIAATGSYVPLDAPPGGETLPCRQAQKEVTPDDLLSPPRQGSLLFTLGI